MLRDEVTRGSRVNEGTSASVFDGCLGVQES